MSTPLLKTLPDEQVSGSPDDSLVMPPIPLNHELKGKAEHVTAACYDKLFTVEAIAEFLAIEVSTVRYYASRGEIPVIRIGRHLRFDKNEVLQYFKNKANEGMSSASAESAIKLSVQARLSSLKTRISKPVGRP